MREMLVSAAFLLVTAEGTTSIAAPAAPDMVPWSQWVQGNLSLPPPTVNLSLPPPTVNLSLPPPTVNLSLPPPTVNLSLPPPTVDTDSALAMQQSTASLAVYNTGVLSARAFQRMRQVQNWIYLAVEPVAVVLMVLCAVAFLRDRHSPSNCYLAAVCLAAGWYMLMLFTHYLCRLRHECWVSKKYVMVSTFTVSYGAFSARRCCYVLNALVAFQRFVAVAFPLQSLGVRLFHKPVYPLALCVSLCLLMALYRPLRHQPVFMQDGQGGGWVQGYNQLYREHQAVFMALEEVAKYVLQYLPMLACLLANALLLVALARHRKDAGRLGSTRRQDSKAELQMTLMIMGSTLLMLLLYTPGSINEAVSTYSDTYGIMKKNHYLYLVVRSCTSIVAHTCDILVALSYLVLSANFRRRFLGLFLPVRRLLPCCCCCCRCKPLPAARPLASSLSPVTEEISVSQVPVVKADDHH